MNVIIRDLSVYRPTQAALARCITCSRDVQGMMTLNILNALLSDKAISAMSLVRIGNGDFGHSRFHADSNGTVEMSRSLFPRPPAEEQAAIVEYTLTMATADIRNRHRTSPARQTELGAGVPHTANR